MPGENRNPAFSDDSISRTLSGISCNPPISVDLVAAARRHLFFLRRIADSPWLHNTPTLLQAIRRYDEFWMPLISDISKEISKSPMLLPPIDVQWVWHCHFLNPVAYRQYCESISSKIIEKPAILDDENEDYAASRCRDLWNQRYPSEPFDLDLDHLLAEDSSERVPNENLIFAAVCRYRSLYTKFGEPYVAEPVYLIAARHRYKGFLHLLTEYRDEGHFRLIPTYDILLMWLTHQSFPSTYASDTKEMEEEMAKIVEPWEVPKEEDVKLTKKLWEATFNQPYEKAGATFDGNFTNKSPLFWDVSDADVNGKYKTLEPRFLLEVSVFLKGNWDGKKARRMFLRLRTVRCHRDLKIDIPISDVSSASWQKKWHLYCEFGIRGVVLELRQHGGGFLRNSKLKKTILFLWNDLLRATSLTLQREVASQVKVVGSITPPVQAPYLLKCVPDRVTDDTGAMISDVILRMNQYRPQEGRWLSRTVLDHSGRECFVIRIRVGGGFWRRGAETPAVVKWGERIIEVREGTWSYVAGSEGTAPEKVVGTATPKEEDLERKKAIWYLSTGDILTIHWDENGLNLSLQSDDPEDQSSVRKSKLLTGRRLRYQGNQEASNDNQDEDSEDGFVTLVRCTLEEPNGKATALLNWRLFVVEFSPEEDVVMILLLCMAIIRSISEFQREDVGRLLVRRREKEARVGRKDWGSVMLHPSVSSSSSTASVHIRPWYWNAKEVFASPEGNYSKQQTYNYSPADGGDALYRRGLSLEKHNIAYNK